MAFWVNAYNAFVLADRHQSLSDPRTSSAFPANSIRQIPGAFEQDHLACRRPDRDARSDREDHPAGVQGAAALPGARPRRDRQRPAAQRGLHRRRLEQAARPRSSRSSSTTATCYRIDRLANQVSVTPILSWRERGVHRGLRQGATGRSPQRSPIERAIVAFITPHLLPLEKEFLQKNEFKVTFHRVRLAAQRPDGRPRELTSHVHALTLTSDSWISDSPTRSPSSPARAAGSAWRARGRSSPKAAASCLCARGAERLAEAAVEVEAAARRPNMVHDGAGRRLDGRRASSSSIDADRRDVRRPRHPRQQRRPRRRHAICSTRPTPSGRRRSTRRCFRRSARRAWPCRT